MIMMAPSFCKTILRLMSSLLKNGKKIIHTTLRELIILYRLINGHATDEEKNEYLYLAATNICEVNSITNQQRSQYPHLNLKQIDLTKTFHSDL